MARTIVVESETRKKIGEERFAAYVAEAEEGDRRVAKWLASPHRKTVPWASGNQAPDYTPEQMEAWASYEPSAAFMEMPESEKVPLDYTPQQLIDWAPEVHVAGASVNNETKGAVSRLSDGTELRCDISLAAVENSDKHAALPRADQRKLEWGAKYVPSTLVSLAKLRKNKKNIPTLMEFARKNRVIPSLRPNSSPEALVGSDPRNYIWLHPSYGLVVTLSGTREYLTPKVRTFVALMGMQPISLDFADDTISISIAFDHESESDVATVLTAADIRRPKQKATAAQRANLAKARAVRTAQRQAEAPAESEYYSA
jgi:hypothetical protein